MVYYDSTQKFQETPLPERWNWISALSRWCIMTACKSSKKRHYLNAETGFRRSADGVLWQHAKVPRNAISWTLKLDFSVQKMAYYDSMQKFQETPLAERWNWISAFSRWCIMTACKSSKNVISWTLKLDFSAQLMVYYDSMQKFQETPLAERWNWISAFSRWCIMTACKSLKKRH